MKSLYPTPKTFKQRHEEDLERIERLKGRLPKLPWVGIPVFGTIVFFLLAQFVVLLPEMWSKEDMGLIFFSFAIWLTIGGLFIKWMLYTRRVIYAYGRSFAIFFFCYALFAAILFSAYGTGMLPSLFGLSVVLTTALIHFSVTLVLCLGVFFVKFNQSSRR